MKKMPTSKRASEMFVRRYTQERAALDTGECKPAAALGEPSLRQDCDLDSDHNATR